MELKKLTEENLTRQPEEVFDILCKLGKGSYGSVYKAIHKDSKQILAIKQVPVDNDLQEIIKEISIMQQCDSPHVVKYYGTYFKGSELWIVMEFCGAGSVLDIMKLRGKTANQSNKTVKTFDETQIATILRGTLKGLEYLHLRKKIHRDIKAGNILLTSEGHSKLADFGVAAQLDNTVAKRVTLIGTPLWMAPEVIQEIGYDCVADIWSLGITALQMAEGKVPYMAMHPVRAMFMIIGKPPPSFSEPDKWSQEFIEFVSRCLVKNSQNRATASDLLKDDFIENMSKSSEALIPMISEAQQIRDSLQESCIGDCSYESDELNKTLVEENGSTTSDQNGDLQVNGTMIQHSTFVSTEMITHHKTSLAVRKVDEVDGLSSEVDTMVINGDEDARGEGTHGTKTNGNDRLHNSINETGAGTQIGFTINNSDQTSKSSKTLAAKNSSDLCDIEIAEQYYMNSNMIIRNQREENIYSNLPVKEDKQIQDMFGTNSSTKDLKEGNFKFIKCLSTEELRLKLQGLDKDMESEIERITSRFHIKRQPILDGIQEKENRKHQENF